MKKTNPSISVILPVYNGVLYLNESINSILQQSFRDFELIIINDGSTDGSESIIEKYITNERRIRYFKKGVNSGLIDTLNFGISLAKGEYIARMDADDICFPNRFAIQKLFLDNHPEIGVVGSNLHFIDGSGKRLSNFVNNPRLSRTSNQIKWSLCFECCLMHPTIMARRELLVKVGGYKEGTIHAEDYELWTRLAKETQFFNLPQKLLYLRRHETNITTIHFDTTLIHSCIISNRYTSTVLRKPVPFELTEYLWSQNPPNMQNGVQLISHFNELFQEFLTYDDMTKSDLGFIRRKTTQKIIDIANRNHISKDVQKYLLYTAFRKDTIEFLRFILILFLRQVWKKIKPFYRKIISF